MDSKPRISKHIINKLPDAFMFNRTTHKNKQNNESKRQGGRPETSAVEKTDVKQGIIEKKRKKNRNPFLTIKEWMQLSEQIEARMEEVRKGLDTDRLSKFNFENNELVIKHEGRQQSIRYQDCLTLEVLKRNESSSFKKILHVPHLKIYYMMESSIDISIEKLEIEQWIRKCNIQAQRSVCSMSIVKLYWNVPEGFYSILYEFTSGALFETVLESINALPLRFLHRMIKTYLQSPLQIFNSQLIIQRQQDSKLAYIPLYEQSEDILYHRQGFRDLMKISGDNAETFSSTNVARLGFYVLLGYFGNSIVDQDMSEILFQSENDCCLIHKFLNNPQSLTAIFVESNFQSRCQENLKHNLIDFLCKCLKFRPEARAKIQELIKHPFYKLISQIDAEEEVCSLSQTIESLSHEGVPEQPEKTSAPKDLILYKMNRILESMTVILQGSSTQKYENVDLSTGNQNICELARDFGLFHYSPNLDQQPLEDLISKLRRIYH